MRIWRVLGATLALVATVPASGATLAQAMAYPFVSGLTSAPRADRIAWVRTLRGLRNIWVADGPAWTPRQVTRFSADDGQELGSIAFSPDGTTLVFVRGGDHDENWPAKGNLAPNPTSGTEEQKITLWSADPAGNRSPLRLAEGDAPAVSAKGVIAYLKDCQVWTVGHDGAKPKRLFFDRGTDSDLAWSPDGSRLAFVSTRDGTHSFIGVYAAAAAPLMWMSPSTGFDHSPAWSPDGTHIAFTRQPGDGGAPLPLLTETAQPWAIMTADAATGGGRQVWTSPGGLRGNYPETDGGANLRWGAGGRLGFVAEIDGWPHLYSVAATGGAATLLTSGAYMVEHVALSRDGAALLYAANTGTTPGDDDRRHVFRVALTGGAPVALTPGDGIEWTPVPAGGGVAYVSAGAKAPPAVAIAGTGAPRVLAGQSAPAEFALAALVVPRPVTWAAPDGLNIHGQIFDAGGSGKRPGVIFIHGGPPRQMLLGWHYMDYYSHAYAMNQYLASRGYVVMTVNYRLGIGYGREFQHPDKGGSAGSSEYQDIVSAGRFLAGLPGVDGARIGLWGGSYGGLLTALGLARDSKLFKAGVDLHGVHDWNRILVEELPSRAGRFEQGDLARASEIAWKASPVADVERWTSPVLLIHGDDDRNVRFNQTVDLVNRLARQGVEHEELVLPDEIHGFLRAHDWLTADAATADFLARHLGGAR